MRNAKPSVALQSWAMIAQYGAIPSWRPQNLSGGVPDACDWHQGVYHRVERFWLVRDHARWRSMVLRLMLDCRPPSMREHPQFEMFRTEFGRWWRDHGVPPPTILE